MKRTVTLCWVIAAMSMFRFASWVSVSWVETVIGVPAAL